MEEVTIFYPHFILQYHHLRQILTLPLFSLPRNGLTYACPMYYKVEVGSSYEKAYKFATYCLVGAVCMIPLHMGFQYT